MNNLDKTHNVGVQFVVQHDIKKQATSCFGDCKFLTKTRCGKLQFFIKPNLSKKKIRIGFLCQSNFQKLLQIHAMSDKQIRRSDKVCDASDSISVFRGASKHLSGLLSLLEIPRFTYL